MSLPFLLHVISPNKYVSPFDINMAYEANYDDVIPYCNIGLDEVHGLTQDTIFSRRPEGVKRTAMFIGGRDFHLSLEMLQVARDAMVPPFEISVLVDPSGAITTAAAMLALAEFTYVEQQQNSMQGARVLVYGGTGPVGACVAILAAQQGAEVSVVSYSGSAGPQRVVELCRERYGVELHGADGSVPESRADIIRHGQIIFNTAKAGVEVIDQKTLAVAQDLAVAVDANAVPPAGIAGIGLKDRSAKLTHGPDGAVGYGALTVGDVKYRVHTGLLQRMYESDHPVFLAHTEAFEFARTIVSERFAE